MIKVNRGTFKRVLLREQTRIVLKSGIVPGDGKAVLKEDHENGHYLVVEITHLESLTNGHSLYQIRNKLGQRYRDILTGKRRARLCLPTTFSTDSQN